MLELREVRAGYGRTKVLDGLSLTVRPREVLGVCGPNGAGKSTLLRVIAQQVKMSAGEVLWDGRSIARWSPSRTVRSGIALCPEGRRVFPLMTVEENLRIGGYTRRDHVALSREIDEYLDAWPVIARRRQSRAGMLSGGEQQILAIGRALLSQPRLLLLDEPSLGLAPVLIDQVYAGLRDVVSGRDLSVLLVEQNVAKAYALSDRMAVLSGGCLTFESRTVDTDVDEIGSHYFGSETSS